MLGITLRGGLIMLLLALYSPANAIEGDYEIVGSGAEGQNAYNAEARVQRTGETFSIVWKVGEVGYIGTGIVSDETLSVVFQPLVPNARAGVASYQIEDDTVVGGTWTILGTKAIGIETWTRLGQGL